jgi:hypothetical protein
VEIESQRYEIRTLGRGEEEEKERRRRRRRRRRESHLLSLLSSFV